MKEYSNISNISGFIVLRSINNIEKKYHELLYHI